MILVLSFRSSFIKWFAFCTMFALICMSGFGQTFQLWGVADSGGASGNGTIFAINNDGTGFGAAYSFGGNAPSGSGPMYNNFIQASNGLLYGMTAFGGINGDGVIFCLNPATFAYTTLYSFSGDSSSGALPYGSLVQASDSLLYGMTYQGGDSNDGVLFRYNPITQVYTTLHSFTGTDGEYPYGSLLQAYNGFLYGMTYGGGSHGSGVIFSFDPVSGTYTKLYNFIGGSLGGNPHGSLIQAADSLMYGMTLVGGSSDSGTIFSFDPRTATYSNLYSFMGGTSSGRLPYGDLLQAANGLLYGMTEKGGQHDEGVIFSYNTTTSVYSDLYSFTLASGEFPYGSLIQGSNRLLYGVTSEGGTNNYSSGVIFSFNTFDSVYTDIYNVPDTLTEPLGSLTQASNGLLYGMANGYINNDGSIFSFSVQSDSLTNHYDFPNYVNGGLEPSGSLIKGSNGSLYGVMENGGGLYDAGAIFSYYPPGNYYSSLYYNHPDSFSYFPTGIIMASNGLLYGIGVNPTFGSIFSLNPLSETFNRLHLFGGFDGQVPQCLIQAPNGILYGSALLGGASGLYSQAGVLFSYNINTSTYSDIHDFAALDSNGSEPVSLVAAPDSLLYGITETGGNNNDGVIFSYNIVNSAYKKLYSFLGDSASGAQPWALIRASDSLLYGMTSYGGVNNDGVIFSFNLITSTYTNLHNFNGSDGANPQRSIMQGSDGLLYGMTSLGGNYGGGVIFCFNPGNNSYTVLANLNTSSGFIPCGPLLQLSPIVTALNVENVNLLFCPDDSVVINFGAVGSYNPGNTFTAQLSNASGQFTSPVTIGTINSTNSGIINATIPVNTSPGAGYRIRVVSSSPSTTGADNGVNITINPSVTVLAGAAQSACYPQSTVLITDGSAGNYYNLLWTSSGTGSFTSTNSLNTSYQPSSLDWANGSVTLSLIGMGVCSNDTSFKVLTLYAVPDSSLTVSGGTTFCQGDSVILKTDTGAGFTYEWELNGQTITGATSPVYVATQGGTYKLIESSSVCSATSSATVNITVNPSPAVTVTDNSPVCIGSTIHLTTSVTGGTSPYSNYTWSTPDSFNLGNTPNPTRTNASLAMSGIYAVTVTDSKGCSAFDAVSFDLDSLTDSLSITNAGSPTSLGYITVYAFGVPPYTYNWSTGDNTATIQEPVGEYVLSISDGAGCVDVDSGFIGVSGITDLTGSNWVKIYPNPAQDVLYIKFSNTTNAEIKILDITGKIVANFESKEQIEAIYISNLTQGEYIVSIFDKGGGQLKFARIAKI